MLRVQSTRRVLASDTARGIEWEEIRLLTERYAPEALRERVSTLNAALLRITASLDVDTVLREVVDSARALTGARYGVIATVDQTGLLPTA